MKKNGQSENGIDHIGDNVDFDPELNDLLNAEVSGPGVISKVISQEHGEGLPVNINSFLARQNL
jgi:hypothetical protein